MMKKNLLVGTALGLILGASAASAEPAIVEANAEPLVLNDAELDGVTAGFFFGSSGFEFPDFELKLDGLFGTGLLFEFGPAFPFPD